MEPGCLRTQGGSLQGCPFTPQVRYPPHRHLPPLGPELPTHSLRSGGRSSSQHNGEEHPRGPPPPGQHPRGKADPMATGLNATPRLRLREDPAKHRTAPRCRGRPAVGCSRFRTPGAPPALRIPGLPRQPGPGMEPAPHRARGYFGNGCRAGPGGAGRGRAGRGHVEQPPPIAAPPRPRRSGASSGLWRRASAAPSDPSRAPRPPETPRPRTAPLDNARPR